MSCQQSQSKISCPCSYPGCSRKGTCCECIRYHREKGQLPACYFSFKAEKSYDRSIEAFIADWQQQKE